MNGLPAIANNLAAKGRYGDSMLMHVSPGEVRGLQALAQSQGTSLTTNPDTGLPEAFKLKDLLPMIAGLALGPAGLALMPAWGAGLAVGGIEALRTGDIGKGLMAGLGAYGGAGLGQALTSAGTSSVGNMAANLGVQGAATGAGSQAAQLAAQNAGFGQAGIEATRQAAAGAAGANMAPALSNFQLAGQGISGLAEPGGFSNLATGLGQAFPSTMGKTAATMGLTAPLMQQKPMDFPESEDPYANYEGPYTPSERRVSYPGKRDSTSEFMYFDPSNPVPFAGGGSVPMLEDGGFVLTKKSVDGIVGGDNRRGQATAARGLGAIPIKGKGHGTSDSIKTSIDGRVPARVSNGEAYVPRRAVKRAGGADKLYALMRKAERRA